MFLTSEGCGVYPDRPLVCRLYPLGQRVKGSGDEQFIAMTPHPETEGTYGQAGTVADFLNTQDVESFMAARNRYLKIVHQALHRLASLTSEDQEIYETAIQTFENQGYIARTLSSWLDVDHVVFRYCLEKGLPEPQGLEERVELHFASLKSWIDHLIQGDEHEGHSAIT